MHVAIGIPDTIFAKHTLSRLQKHLLAVPQEGVICHVSVSRHFLRCASKCQRVAFQKDESSWKIKLVYLVVTTKFRSEQVYLLALAFE